MKFKEYRLEPYKIKYRQKVIELECQQWGVNRELNEKYFHWKYEENPYSQDILGVVVLHGNRLIGFNGLLVTQWAIFPKKNFFYMLQLCDAIVDKEYRGNGIHKAMLRFMCDYYGHSKYRLITQYSGWKISIDNAMKIGWIPIYRRNYYQKYSIVGLFYLVLTKMNVVKEKEKNITLSTHDNIEISKNIYADSMVKAIAKQTYDNKKMVLWKDESYLKWRFRNPRHQYIFFYQWHKQTNHLINYVVFRTSLNRKNAKLVDFACTDIEKFSNLIGFVVRSGLFKTISILETNEQDPHIKYILNQYRFKKEYSIINIKKKLRKKNDRTILIKPLTKVNGEESWFINGVDIKNPENWLFLEIGSDNV